MAVEMKSQRVLVKVAGAEDWRGDDLRFRPGNGDAHARLDELDRSYRHITDLRVVESADEPTHAYGLDGTLQKLSDASPPGYRDRVDAPPPVPLYVDLPTAESNLTWGGVLMTFGLLCFAIAFLRWLWS